VPDGEDGELVFTSLTKEAFPVIRYRTRDLTRLLPPTSRSFRRMGKISGRSDDMLIVRGVNVFPTQIEEQILRDQRLSRQLPDTAHRDGHLDNVEVRCELQRELSRTTVRCRSTPFPKSCSTTSRPMWAFPRGSGHGV
jgi:phenylacetate-CoA ligase